MLNAFRHQRKEHGSFPHVRLVQSGAQRLSASTEGTLGPWPSRIPARGAQRLSASTEGTRAVGRLDQQRDDVLNAFRHQRKEHEAGGGFIGRFGHVLNAFRHQRKEHIWQCDSPPARSRCSTPFGINGRNTARERDRTPCHRSAQRLSASTEGTPLDALRYLVMSIVLNAFRHQRKEHASHADKTADRQEVLNAFRHQRKEHAMRHCIIFCDR